MKAVESAPSANKSRSKFGNRNAIKKASRYFPAPNKPANTISRIKPRTRLDKMAMPTTPVARVLIRRSSAAVIGEHFVGRFCETPILNSVADPTTNPATAGRINTNHTNTDNTDEIWSARTCPRFQKRRHVAALQRFPRPRIARIKHTWDAQARPPPLPHPHYPEQHYYNCHLH